MRIAMIGTGYVGLVTGVCLSEFGFEVTCVEQDGGKVAALKRGEPPIYEPGLDALMSRNTQRLAFTTDLPAAVAEADVVFIAVGTPERRGGDGEADLSYVHGAARQIARAIRPGTTVAIKSTVVVGTARAVRATMEAEAPGLDFSIASNPEFLREGSAIEDFMRPDRVVVGVEDGRGEEALRRLYRPLNLRETPLVVTGLEDAELIKYAANAFLAMKITFINEVADLCEKSGGNVQEVARSIGMDNRIGSKFLHPGPGYGGSCFPKDTRALASVASRLGARLSLVEAAVQANETRVRGLAGRVIAAAGGSVAGRVVAVLGVAFKPNTDDVREAASLTLVPALQAAGATVRAHDPQAMAAAAPLLPGVTWCADAYQAADGADILVVLTEWNEYRGLALSRVAMAMRGRLIVDLRNVFRLDEVADTGFRYVSVGRPVVGGQTPPLVADSAEKHAEKRARAHGGVA
jgi:UDPglucose 6-dehydrogenase